MRDKILYGVISILMAAGLLVAVPAFAQTAQSGQGGGAAWGGPRSGMSQRAPGVFGTVTAISGDSITLSSKGFGPSASSTSATTYTVDATNATVTKSGSASSVGAIAVGDTLMVQGTVSGDSVTATSINDGVPQGGIGGFGGGARPGVVGTVSAVSGDTLTVTSKTMTKGPSTSGSSSATATTYTVDATNATVVKDGATSTVSAIATGDTVMIQGTVSGDSVTATMIRDGVMPQGQGQGGGALASLQGNGEPVIGGSVSAISGDTLTVTNKSNVTYSVDATNATVIVKNATSSLSAVATGDNVIVQGTVNGTSVTASSVIDQGAASASSGSGGGASGMMHGIGGVFGAIGGFIQHLFGFF